MKITGWRYGLYSRIALAFAALITVVLLAQVFAFYRVTSRGNSDDVHQQGLAWTRAVGADLGQLLEQSADADVAQRLAQIDVTQRVFVMFRDGRVIGPTPPEVVITTVSGDFGLVRDEGPVPVAWELGPFCAAAVKVHGKVIGVVGIKPRTAFERFGPIIGIAGTILLIGAIALFSVVVVRPLRTRLIALQTAAKRLGRGELQTRVAISGTDEVSEVAQAFNSMADDLEQRTTALETSDRLRRQLVADVSHELMTPLTAVLGHLETLDMDEVRVDERERRRQLAIATREARRLRRIIGDLLTTARYEAGGVELNWEEVETSELFKQIAARHEYDCRARHVTFETALTPDAAAFEADPFRIEQAIENVVANALRHTPDGGRVSLTAARNGDNIIIEVCDSGEGIPAEHLPHVFDRFYKASSARGLASPGSGLGLSIVKAIVTSHGGRVSATSAPGIGTIVRMEFPLGASLVEPQPVA